MHISLQYIKHTNTQVLQVQDIYHNQISEPFFTQNTWLFNIIDELIARMNSLLKLSKKYHPDEQRR